MNFGKELVRLPILDAFNSPLKDRPILAARVALEQQFQATWPASIAASTCHHGHDEDARPVRPIEAGVSDGAGPITRRSCLPRRPKPARSR